MNVQKIQCKCNSNFDEFYNRYNVRPSICIHVVMNDQWRCDKNGKLVNFVNDVVYRCIWIVLFWIVEYVFGKWRIRIKSHKVRGGVKTKWAFLVLYFSWYLQLAWQNRTDSKNCFLREFVFCDFVHLLCWFKFGLWFQQSNSKFANMD